MLLSLSFVLFSCLLEWQFFFIGGGRARPVKVPLKAKTPAQIYWPKWCRILFLSFFSWLLCVGFLFGKTKEADPLPLPKFLLHSSVHLHVSWDLIYSFSLPIPFLWNVNWKIGSSLSAPWGKISARILSRTKEFPQSTVGEKLATESENRPSYPFVDHPNLWRAFVMPPGDSTRLLLIIRGWMNIWLFIFLVYFSRRHGGVHVGTEISLRKC